jgi:hypothetical protein
VNIGGTNYSVGYTLDMSNGQVSSGNSPQGADGYTFNWIFLVRELQGGGRAVLLVPVSSRNGQARYPSGPQQFVSNAIEQCRAAASANCV